MPYDTTDLVVTGLNTGHELFSEVFEAIPENLDLPGITGHYPLGNYRDHYHDVIMDLQNGDPYLIVTQYGKGKVYLLTSPLGDAFGTLARHAIWVPIMYRMAMLSRPQEQIFYTMGDDNVITTGMYWFAGEDQLLVKLIGSDYEFIPALQKSGENSELLLYDRIAEAGHYEMSSSGELLMGFSFNYSRMESDPSLISSDQLIEMIENQDVSNIYVVESATEQVSHTISELSLGTGLWKLFIRLALLFILLEILLLRLFRK